RRRAAGRLPHVEHDLAGRAPLIDRVEGVGGALEREARADDRTHEALLDEPLDLRADRPVGLGLGHHVRAPAGADHLDAVEPQATCSAAVPTPPAAPWTSTVSPSASRPRSRSAKYAVW